jgi:selenocysteine lyase/cysteine desulfurase
MQKALSNRLDYPCLKTHSYLNQASLGLIGDPAVAAMHGFLDTTARHGNLYMSDAQEAAFLQPLRASVSHLIGCAPENLAIVSSASEILAQVPTLFTPKPKSKIITVASDFPAITRPWIAACHLMNCQMIFVDDVADQNLTRAIIDQIDAQTAAVCVSYVQFSTGTCLDIPMLREATSKVGAKLAVDITQAAGALAFSVRDWHADIIVASGYKWLGGHGGIGFAVLCDELLQKQPPLIGWFGGEYPFDMDAKTLMLAKTAAKYTQSTLSYITAMGLKASIEELLKLGLDNIDGHSQKLASALISGLSGSDWTPFHSPGSPGFSPHIVTLQNPSCDVRAVEASLTENCIICSIRNGRVRVSLAHYNSQNDVNALINNLQ